MSESDSPTVLFDESHGQRFFVGQLGELDLSGLGKLLREDGAEISSTVGPITLESLESADGLIISGPFAAFTPTELSAIRRFIHDGGRVCVMLHIAPTAVGLLQTMGATPSNGVINEAENVIGENPLDFAVTRLKPHPVTEGVSRFHVYGSWAVINTGAHARVLAETSPKAWLDSNRNRNFDEGEVVQSYGVALAGRIGRGEFVVFGDDAIFQNRFLQAENRILAKNLARWLISRD